MVQENAIDEMPRIFFRSFVDFEDGLRELEVPEDVIEDALDRIQMVIRRALERSEEAEDGEGDSDGSREEGE